MKALLVVAHGSRRMASNDEVIKLCERLQEEKGEEEFDVVMAGFLELAQPSIPEGIDECVRLGAEEVVVLPYFLSAGRHVSEDIPAEVEKARAANPHVSIQLAPYLGSAPGVSRLLVELAEGGERNGHSTE
ncbi:MAG TPA: cobalamin biosynthesis protein CbiX [Chromatiaceae bacterium]|nr:cobalamin biosynthesis protein CbiX [Chromatiaceae bacterium]